MIALVYVMSAITLCTLFLKTAVLHPVHNESMQDELSPSTEFVLHVQVQLIFYYT